MKRLLLIIILTLSFQLVTKADDVSDFEIEGMSIGDSLLDFMKEDLIIHEINNKDYSFYYNKDFVSISTWEIRDKFKSYDDVGVILKIGDNQYKIHGLMGTLYMDKKSDIKECYKKQDEIVKNVKSSLNLINEGQTWFAKKQDLMKHQLSVKYIDFELSSGGAFRFICYDIIEGAQKNSDGNLLYVAVNSDVFWDYLDTY